MTETTRRQEKKALKNAAFFAAYVFAFALVWTIAYGAVENAYVLPSLWEVCKAAGRLLKERFFYESFLRSFLRVLSAFSLSFVCGAAFATLAKVFPVFGKIVAPVIKALRALPTMAIMLVLLLWSTPDRAPVIVAFLALFPVLYTGMSAAISTVDKNLEEMCEIYRVPMQRRVFSMYLPLALPYALREAAGGISFALKLVVSAEVLASTYVSLGGMLQLSKIYMQTPEMFALALLVIVVGLLLEGLGELIARCVERRFK